MIAQQRTRAPSTPRAARSHLRNIPVHLRTALRRALEFEARAPAPRSAEEAEQCEEQLRAIADEFFGALLTPVLQRAVVLRTRLATRRAPSCATCPGGSERRPGDRQRSHLPGHDGAGHAPYYREKHARRAKRTPGLYPELGGVGHLRPVLAEAGLRLPRAVAMLSVLAAAQAQLRSDGIALDIDRPLDRLSLRCAGPSDPAEPACGLLDRVTAGWSLPRRLASVRV